MISEEMPDKVKEIVRDMWPGIFMRPKKDDEGLPTRDEGGVKLSRNVPQGP